MVCLVGIANPLIDRSIWMKIGDFAITGGMISMVTLVFKGVFALVASYLLIATTSIESICYALRLLHVPRLIVTVIMLIYRYIILFMKEVERISLAYSLRAPKQKGIHYKAWGSLLGQMLLRSIDRADIVYESMTIRGFKGEFYLRESSNQGLAKNITSVLYVICAGSFITVFRLVPIFELVGRLFE
jgi:cobalt/nickel transport system permease protein